MIKGKIKDIAGLAEGIFKTLQEKSESLPIKEMIEMGVDMVGSQILDVAGFKNEIDLKIKRLPHFKGDLPQYKTTGSSGMDVRACIDEAITIEPGKRALIPTGMAMKVSEAYEIQARPRSGLALKKGLTLLNTPGTIDADYRGEVQIIMANLGDAPVTIEDGERIAQLVICPVVKANISVVDELDDTERGEGGFGSTGSH
ncbi:MAG: dUTP diphosphatase [Bdellovibrionales bacterium]